MKIIRVKEKPIKLIMQSSNRITSRLDDYIKMVVSLIPIIFAIYPFMQR